MNHPLFRDTITLYKRRGEEYTRHVLRGVQWRQKIERAMSSQGVLQMQAVTSITIPADPHPAAVPEAGDVIILGEGMEITDAYPVSALRADHAGYCTVRAVGDNTLRPRLKHWKVYAV